MAKPGTCWKSLILRHWISLFLTLGPISGLELSTITIMLSFVKPLIIGPSEHVCNGCCMGISNLPFSHNVARIQKHKSKISCIQDPFGNSFETPEGISDCFRNFFSTLWSSSSSKTIDQIFHSFPGDLPSLTCNDVETLPKPVNKHEIFRVL